MHAGIPRAPAGLLRSGLPGDFFRGPRGPSLASVLLTRAPLAVHILLPAAATDEPLPGRGLLVARERPAKKLGKAAQPRHRPRDLRAPRHCEPSGESALEFLHAAPAAPAAQSARNRKIPNRVPDFLCAARPRSPRC